MTIDCIICTAADEFKIADAKKSKEHVFPAILGGRRANGNIYCKQHNEGFSPLVVILAESLSVINALLRVRPDRKKHTHTAILKSKDGAEFILSGNHIKLAPPELPESVIENINKGMAETIQLSFSDEAQLQKFRDEQRKQGIEIRVIEKKSPQQHYFIEPLGQQIGFGGANFLRSICYLALTYLAHYFPDLARQDGALKLKRFIQENSAKELVWWESPDVTKDISTKPYRFAHIVRLAVSKEKNEAYVRISLFSAFNYAICIGPLVPEADKSVLLYIDPQGELPNEIHEFFTDTVDFVLTKPASPTDELRNMIQNGSAEEVAQKLLREIEDWHIDLDVSNILNKLNEIDTDNQNDIEKTLKSIVDARGQLILNKVLRIGSEMRHYLLSGIENAGPLINPFFDNLLAINDGQPENLHPITLALIEDIKTKLAKEIENHFREGKLDHEKLRELITYKLMEIVSQSVATFMKASSGLS